MSPLDYSLCTQTVTVYRRQEDTVQRVILENCYLELEEQVLEDVLGQQSAYRFLLIVPGQEQLVFAGDRVTVGIGPEDISWVQTGGFPQVEYARICCWDGCICHTEAGRKVR